MIEFEADLINYQIKFDEFRKKIVELKMNLKYYEINSKKSPLDEKIIQDLIKTYNRAKEFLSEYAKYRIIEDELPINIV